MPWCVVKKCVSNNEKQGDKISTFKVPNDQDLREKWRMAIGVNILRSSHRVCELHFEEHLVIKDYIHKTKDGNIIAQVPLKHHHLKAGAVPAIFKRDNSSRERSPSKFQKFINDITLDHCYAAQRTSPNVGRPDIDVARPNPNVDQSHVSVAKSAAERSKAELDGRIKEETPCNMFSSSKTETPDYDENTTRKVGEFKGNVSQICKTVYQNNVSSDVDTNSSFPSIVSKSECNSDADDSITKSEEIGKHIKSETSDRKHNNAPNGITISSTQFCIKVAFKFSTPCSDTVGNEVEVKLPKPWGLQRSMVGGEEVLIFTYVVESTDNGTQTHIFEKTVLIKSSREIVYEVFSRKVNTPELELPKILTDFKMLPEILKKFKNFKICKGVPDKIPNRFKTSMLKTLNGMDLRHRDCFLLSFNSDKCRSCRTYSILIEKSIKRSKRRKIVRVDSSKSAEQCKLKALGSKVREQEQEKRLKYKLSLLTDAITDR